MIISSEHHDLVEQYEEASRAFGRAVEELRNYYSLPNKDPAIIRALTARFEETNNAHLDLLDKLKALSLAP